MTQRILENIYRIELPMKVGLLDSLNAYLILGERNLLIDTGYDRDEIYSRLKDEISSLGADINQTDIYLTHLHPDHSELSGRISRETGAPVFIGAHEADILNGKSDRPEARGNYIKTLGFPREFFEEFERSLPKRKSIGGDGLFTGIGEGDILEYGGYTLEVLDIAGHSPGHTGLYIADKKLLFSGDHILYGVTPSISAWEGESNPLEVYINNLEKLKNYEIDILLPGHREATCPAHERIDQIISRHNRKIEETLSRLRLGGSMSAFEIASVITWKTRWEKLTPFQQFSAAGEIAINLEYLCSHKMAGKETRGDAAVYFITEH